MNFIKKLLDSEYKELCRFEKLAEEIEKEGYEKYKKVEE